MQPKGLVNESGENRCYLNSSLQMLWNQPIFREALAACQTSPSAHLSISLQALFANYAYGDDQTLHSEEVVLGSIIFEVAFIYMGEEDNQLKSGDMLIASYSHIGSSRSGFAVARVR